jgi:hypothetical protein
MYEPFQQPPEADLLDEEEICRHDVEADADALLYFGGETDEDENHGMEDRFLDSFWESQTECDFGGSDF